jgi:tetratricopeptide (TPR) repeat protein
MYYIALRNYGIQQINNGYLENGVYNITLAEALGPVDTYADSMRVAARAYLSGAGFWEINWNKALEYYSNAAMTYPNLYDRATMMTANQRYAQASFEVANLYIISEDYCGAIPYFNQGLPIAGTESMQMTATAVYLECYPPVVSDVPTGQSESGEPVQEEYYEPPAEEFYFAG